MAAVPKSPSTVCSGSYETPMQASWNFDYEGAIPKVDDLCERAKDNRWNAAELDWYTPIDPSNPIMAPKSYRT